MFIDIRPRAQMQQAIHATGYYPEFLKPEDEDNLLYHYIVNQAETQYTNRMETACYAQEKIEKKEREKKERRRGGKRVRTKVI